MESLAAHSRETGDRGITEKESRNWYNVSTEPKDEKDDMAEKNIWVIKLVFDMSGESIRSRCYQKKKKPVSREINNQRR